MIEKEVFHCLKEIEVFMNRCIVMNDTLAWDIGGIWDNTTCLDIDTETLYAIINNSKLKLRDEDQLLNFINHLYKSDSKYSILYEAVLFENVTKERMKEFTQIYKCKYMTNGTWNRLLKRLELEVVNEKKDDIQNNRIHIGKDFSSSDENAFNGILKYLKIQSNEQIA